MVKKLILIVITFLLNQINIAQSPIGNWKSIDDKTKGPKSQINIYEQNGKLYGKVEKLLAPNANVTKKCTDCSGNKKNQLILGMVIMENLIKKGNKWTGGTIADPENGKSYDVSIWFDENEDELKVRGYHWTGLYRTQTWYRIK